MATTSQMILAGIALLMDTVVLIYSAFIGDKIFQPIYKWYYSFQYSSPPPIDPGIITWVPAVYYGMLLAMWFALVFAMYVMVANKAVYQWGI